MRQSRFTEAQIIGMIKEQEAGMREHKISQRRACRLVGVDPKTVRRDQPPDNPKVREEMKAIASSFAA